MDATTSAAYHAYYAQANKADEIKDNIKELYGEATIRTLILAKRDGIITSEECDLVRRFMGR